MYSKTSFGAIPTIYKGIQMRSRLEARWAAYWDLRGDTQWNYEPVDLKGWIPDFEVSIPKAPRPYVAEIKPVRTLAHFTESQEGKKILNAFYESRLYITENYMAFILLGIDPNHTWYFGPHKASNVFPSVRWTTCSPVDATLQKLWIKAGNMVQWKAPK